MSLPEKCPLCGAKPDKQTIRTHHVYHGKPGQGVFLCNTCDLTYLHPILSAEEKDIFYAEEFPEFMAGRAAASEGAGWLDPEDHIATNETQRKRRMKYLEPLAGKIPIYPWIWLYNHDLELVGEKIKALRQHGFDGYFLWA